MTATGIYIKISCPTWLYGEKGQTMENVDVLYLCERCKKKVEKNGHTVLSSAAIDNHDLDYECDLCGALAVVLDRCEVETI